MVAGPLTNRRVLLAAMLASPFIVSACERRASGEAIRLGFAGALTGPSAFLGQEIRRGGELAVSAINAAGGVLTRPLELISRDDEHTAENTLAAYRELVEQQHVVAMLGATNSAAMLAVVPLVNDTYHIPVVCPATDASAITANAAAAAGQDNYIFRVGMYGEGQANFMVDTAVDRFRYRRVALLTWTGGWGVTGRGEILRRLQEKGLTPVADETYDADDADMTAQLLRIRQARADVILNYGLLADNVKVARSRAQLRDTTPYFSAWGISGAAYPNAAGPAAEGTLISTTATLDGFQSERRRTFIAAYQAAYNEASGAPVFALGAWDATHMIAAAIRAANSTEGPAIRTQLESLTDFDGLVHTFEGPVFTRERHNSLRETDMIVTRVTDGKLLRVEFDNEGPYVTLPDNTRLRINARDMSVVR